MPKSVDTPAIGERVRHLRRQQNRTQQQLADATGFTKSLVCKIEKGNVIPPVATMVKLASALGVPMSALLAETDDQTTIFAPADKTRTGMTRTENGYSIFPFAASFGSKRMQIFLFEARRGEVKSHSVTHDGEEFIYVLEGGMQFTVGPTTFAMHPGDGLFFRSSEPHGFQPTSDVVRYLDIFI
jgi:transcriptional regulator with XRE-family HTH domain